MLIESSDGTAPRGMRVRYHGSVTGAHGTYQIAGVCDCERCEAEDDWLRTKTTWKTGRYLPGRYVLADDHGNRVRHVRGASITPAAPAGGYLELARPADDAELLAMLNSLRDRLHLLAAQLAPWSEALSEIGLPTQVCIAIAHACSQVAQAADDATRAAAAFQTRFEQAREVAARGLTFTGHDTT